MIKLQNIEINGNTITADATCVDTKKEAKLMYDGDEKKLHILSGCKNFSGRSHAQFALAEMLEKKDSRKERTIMWY